VLAGLVMCFEVAAGSDRTADEPDARALIDRYVVWRGGAEFQKLRSTHSIGQLRTSGLAGQLEVWADTNGNRWEHSSIDGIVTAEDVSPERAWRTNLSGQVIPVDGSAAEDMRLEARVLFADILHLNRDAARRVADETLDQRSWRVLEISLQGDACDFFLSDAGELHAVRASHHGSPRITRYEDWRSVAGVRMPFRERVGSTSDGDTRQFAEIVLNAKLPSDLSQPPSDLVHVSEQGSRSAWKPFQLLHGRRIYLPLSINGHSVQALLDSGAETTVLDSATAKLAGVQTVGQMQVQGSGGSAPSGLATGVTVSTGGETLSPLTVSVMDLDAIAKALHIPLQAILGQEAFQAFVVDIDFQRHRIAFRNPATFKPPNRALRLPLLPIDGNRVTKLSVEGRAPINVYLDLGNGSPLDLFPAYWQRERLLEGRRTSQLLNGGAGGQRPVQVAIVDTVSLGGITLHRVPTNFPPPGKTTASSQRVQGNLGLPILARFRVIVDFTHGELFLVPRVNAVTLPFDRDRTGLSTIRDSEALRVTYVAPGSPAEAAGLKAGDRITAIDGHAVTSGSSADADWRLGPAGRHVELSLDDHRPVSIKLKDYY
jgi:hypothetical protein